MSVHVAAAEPKVPKMNPEQKEELYSLQCIYEDSKQVTLELSDSPEELDAAFRVQIAIFGHHKIEMKITLPEHYLGGDQTEMPRYELTSRTLCEDRLKLLREHLDSVTDSPVLFSWIEWLRTDSSTTFQPVTEVPFTRETSQIDSIDDLNDIPESPPAARSQCANCVAPRPADVQLRACSHWLCDTCCSYTWQVYHAQGRPFVCCPLPQCQKMSTDLDKPCTPDAWLRVSTHIVSTRFQDSIVFCPRCEDRGMDIPVLLETQNSSECSHCYCFKCSLAFCGICRSPQHPGESCFDSERRVVRMAKRRPPLPAELAELAARKAEAIRERDQREAELAFSLSQGSNQFPDFVSHFEDTFGGKVLQGLRDVFDHVQLKRVNLAQAVIERFFRQLSWEGMGQLLPAFHGTQSSNYPSIFDRGLLVPGFGAGADLKVAHGQAHGRGIYIANVDAAWLSKGFCDESSMLVCAVLNCAHRVRHVGDAMVVGDPDLVVPLFLAVGTWRNSTLGRGPRLAAAVAALPVPAATAPNPNLKATKLLNGSKGKKLDPKDANESTPAPKPKAKQSKFMARLAARSKRH